MKGEGDHEAQAILKVVELGVPCQPFLVERPVGEHEPGERFD
jgi:hypothetical protein